MLTTNPILKIVDPFNNFILCTDACKEGLGMVLIQQNYVVTYEYRKLKENTNNYSTNNLELASTIHALKCGDTTSSKEDSY